ncbi:right-handed parallel beta-helix repeat-containing protein [Isoptericola sp. NEAU-Y5]|uniref:Right-handed parallel beta-helix repeat-containing protein n=1 Tax=Isoptericola luteus TaxID=2879484 RepID=A0ABS7ZB42_9MICO|nr:pectinesterase family protein [Isoptericola sp. NEAU-Y5]MCA5892263.1 right-handed parallel beta-helix repeat-containing protein [Isoptericola sp. NEAU-Y5]
MPFPADHRHSPDHTDPPPTDRQTGGPPAGLPRTVHARPGRRGRRVTAALAAPVLGLTLLAPAAHATTGTDHHGPDAAVAGQALLHRIGASPATSVDGPVWSPTATGFASVPTAELPDGTTGGAGGRTVTARDAADLAAYASADEPLTILVQGSLDVEPFGAMIDVASDKTIVGAASGGEIVGGGLRLLEVENVIIRNLVFRDSYVPADWDGKSADNDNDGIRIDTSHHVWIDHNEFARLGDGQLDVRKDSTAVTASWNYFHDHNKTLGVGWTDNVVTTLTLHHNRFSNVHQRNGSIDNVALGHLYNNWLSGVSSYGTSSRGGSSLLVESSVFEDARNPLILSGDDARLHQRDNVFRRTWGEEPAETGPTFEASDHYAYTADDTDDVVDLLARHAGTRTSGERVGRVVTVAQDGTGDYLSVHAAVGAAARADRPMEVVVEPGTYREVVSVWPGAAGLTLRGSTGDPEDVVITYDKRASDWPALDVRADDVTLRDLTLENTYDEAANGPAEALAVRSTGARTVLEGVRVLGDRDLSAPDVDPAEAGAALLARLRAPRTTTADGPVWSPVATGFAATRTDELPHGTTGGAGGRTVTVRDAAGLARWAAVDGPVTILVRGSIDVEPFGSMIAVASDKTIVGAGRHAELVGGGLFLDRVQNVVVRNLTFRDSYVPGDWDGKSADNDNDGIRVDTSHHVWIDHNELTRLGDGLIDVRKDSTAVTLSWNHLHDHNKTVGVGWTDNVVTEITMHHNRFANTYQRNASIDNVAAGHLYNNWFDGQAQYGTMARGASQLVVESSVYSNGEDAIVAKDAASEVDSRDNRFTTIRGRKDDTGPTFDPAARYAYTADDVDDVVEVVSRGAGPLGSPEKVGRRVTVALDGSGDFASVGAAVGAASRAVHDVEIVVGPGTYREVVRVWPGAHGLTIRGATGDPRDVVLTYDLAAGQAKFYGGTFGHTGSPTLAVLADDVTLRDLTVENAYDEAAHGNSQALALRTVGDRIVLDDVRLLGNQDTFLADPGSGAAASRVYVTGSYIEGDVDFVYGGGTLVVEDSEIRSLDRGSATNNGYVAAPATVPGGKGFLFTGSRFTSDAAAGTVSLGRPWHPSSNPLVDPSVVVRDSWLGAHVRTPAWSDMSGWSWRDDFMREHANTGPGAAPTGAEVDGRPQLTDDEAARYTRETFLTGDDGWAPWRR